MKGIILPLLAYSIVAGAFVVSTSSAQDAAAIGGRPAATNGDADVEVESDFSPIIDGEPIILQQPLTPPPAGCVPAPAGLVSWWRGEATTTDDWDSNDGPPPPIPPLGTNVVTYTATGKVGRAFASSFTVEDSESLRLINGLTIEAWVYAATNLNLTNHTIVSKYGLPSSVSYIFGCVDRSLYLQVSPTGFPEEGSTLRATQPLPLGTWVHVAATYDGQAMRLYVNGSQVAFADSFSLPIFRGVANVGIGRVPVDPFATATTVSNGFWTWSGYLDEVSIYNRALSADELQGIVNAGSSGKCLSPPVFVVQPASQTVPLGEDVMFAPKVVGLKPISYRWTSNGVVLPLTNVLGSRLLIEKVKTANAGTYSVFVSNSLGAATSSVATLTLVSSNSCFEPPLAITEWWAGEGNGTNLVPFGPSVVTGNFLGTGFPFVTGKVGEAFGDISHGVWIPPRFPPSNTWVVASVPNLNFGPTNSFSIEAWVKADGPRYTSINGGVFKVNSDAADTALIMQKGMTNLTAGYGLFLDRGRLACAFKVSGQADTNVIRSLGPDLRDRIFHHLALTVQRNATNGGNLYVDGVQVLNFDTTQINASISNSLPLTFFLPQPAYPSFLNLDAVSALDEPSFYNRALGPDQVMGIYGAGAAGKRKTRPVIAAQPVSQAAALGSDVQFTITPDGAGFLSYRWLHNGVLVQGGTNRTLILSNITATASGNYSVQVSNFFGITLSSNAFLNILPVALCSNVTVAADATTCMSAASIDAGSYDPDGPGHTVTLLQVPPGPYPLGMTVVMLVATDNLGASNSCTATVTVLDQTPPQIDCPTVPAKPNDPRQCGAIVQFPLPRASDICSAITNIVCDPASGSFFPVGTTMVNCTATDAGGNSARCSFPVTVVDVEAPVISCPTDITVTNAHDAWISVVAFDVRAADNCAGAGAVVATPPSGSTFALGTNPVSCVVTDAAGNVATCSFNVIVQPGNRAPLPVMQVSPLAHFPGWTNLIIIAGRGARAAVTLDGSDSSDPDGDPFTYQWLDGTNVLWTNAIATVALDAGSHGITLSLDDHLPMGTNSAMVTLEIITAGEAVVILSGLVHDSDLSSKARQPLLASLSAAHSCFERGSFGAGANQLGAFQNKVAAQLGGSDPDLAAELFTAAQQIIDAVR